MRIKTISIHPNDIAEFYDHLTRYILTKDDIVKMRVLRESSGFDFRSCKIAYCKFDGDLDKAKEWLLNNESEEISENGIDLTIYQSDKNYKLDQNHINKELDRLAREQLNKVYGIKDEK